MTEKISRERQIEIRWLGDEKTESALLKSIGLQDIDDIASGYCERWLSVPVRKSEVALKALKKSGARVLKPEPGQ